MTDSLGDRFARAIADKDADALRALLTDDVDFRAMTPGRFWEGSTPDDVVDAALGHWFDAGDRIDELVHVSAGATVVDTAAFGYRVRVTNDDGPHLVEQQGYYRASGDRIGYLRLMCSGYRPLDESPTVGR